MSKNDTETMHWQQREREYLMEMCRERGLEVEIIGEKRDNYTIPEYKAARQATDELTAELEILNVEKKEAESIIADVNEQVSESAELVAESKQQLEEINSQIADKEKEYATYEKKIDTLLVAEKPVKRELALIRQDAKQLPVILGGELYLKISEKNLNKLMWMAQGAGTLKNLNMAYEKELSGMKRTIDKLNGHVKNLKNRVKQYKNFLNRHGLLDAFVEYIRPKTMQEWLVEKKAIVEKEKKVREQEGKVKKKYLVFYNGCFIYKLPIRLFVPR